MLIFFIIFLSFFYFKFINFRKVYLIFFLDFAKIGTYVDKAVHYFFQQNYLQVYRQPFFSSFFFIIQYPFFFSFRDFYFITFSFNFSNSYHIRINNNNYFFISFYFFILFFNSPYKIYNFYNFSLILYLSEEVAERSKATVCKTVLRAHGFESRPPHV
jgi:hypothetical protein